MYCCYYKCFPAHKIVKYLICSTNTALAGFHTELKGEASMLEGGLGGMSCKNHDLGG